MSEDIVEFPAVDRMRGDGVRAPHCWFCGGIDPWFQCGCSEARDAQQGRRAKPRYDAQRGCMILDEEILQRNLAWGFARRYEQPVNAVNNGVLTAPVNNAPAVNSASSTQAANRDRNAYHREYMRKKREAAKGAVSGTYDEPAA